MRIEFPTAITSLDPAGCHRRVSSTFLSRNTARPDCRGCSSETPKRAGPRNKRQFPITRLPGLWTAISSRLVFMTHTAKDSPYRKQRFLDVVKKADGSYDLFLDDSPIRTNIPEEWLESEVCRFGFCGEEYRSILREVSLHGRTRLSLSMQWRPNA
jgi:hypothetical protein